MKTCSSSQSPTTYPPSSFARRCPSIKKRNSPILVWLCLAFSVLFGANLACAQTTINYCDTFNRNSALNGSTPSPTDTGSAVWSAQTLWNCSTTAPGGVVGTGGSTPYAALLPLTAAPNSTYVLSYSIIGLSGTTSGWAGFGFWNTASTTGSSAFVNALDWSLQQVNGDGQTFYGSGNLAGGSSTLSAMGGTGNYRITLTVAADGSGTVSYAKDGVQYDSIHTLTAAQVALIQGVGITVTNGVTATIQNFQLRTTMNYSDTFNRNGALNGSTPSPTDTGSAVWSAQTLWNCSTAASGEVIGTGGPTPYAALLPLTAAPNSTYVLSYSILGLSGTSAGWVGLGFWNTASTTGSSAYVNALDWSLQQVNGIGQTFYGSGNLAGGSGNIAGMGGTGNYSITLEIGSDGSGPVTFAKNGTAYGSVPLTAAQVALIQGVGITVGNGVTATIQNFQLTTTSTVPVAQAFVHPGMLHTAPDFARMQANYLNDPWLGSWNRLIANSRSQTTWNPRPISTVIRGGTGQNYGQFYPDVAAAYQSALRYKITGDTAYANQSIRIMNAWSSTMTTLTGDADRYLASGIYGYEFANAAEIMRSYSGWSSSDFTQFQNLMRNVFYPLQRQFLLKHNDACIDNYWANWDLCNIAGMAAIGILCDDRAMYNEALNYFKVGGGQGSINRSIPFIYAGNPTLGQGEEMGRDQGHAGLDVALWGAVCQQFYNQGDDMFAYNNNRVLAGCEYFAQYNLGNNVPFTTFTWGSGTNCTQNSQTVVSSADQGGGGQRPMWDLIYNHYVVLMGLNAPSTTAFAASVRPEGGGGDYGTTSGGFDQLGYTTLTCTLPTSGGPIANGTYRMLNTANGEYVDNLGVTTNGAPVKQWAGSGSNNQRWVFTYSGGYYTISCVSGGLFLDSLSHTGNNSTIGQWASSGSANQQWSIVRSGAFYKIINRANGLCLDTDGQTSNGATMTFWSSGSSNHQLWSFSE